MSHENASVPAADNRADEGAQALSVLRDIWHARAQTSAEIEEACGNTKACKRMAQVGFHGIADDSSSTGSSSVNDDLRAAWKAKLEREGKLYPGATSVRDLILGSSAQTQ
ncbi:hypothetical protein C3Y87_20710 [Carbonactinospora thermoautotrophica]|uniref:Uncharacterized protein n=1 Tax=Carbonactinospora thermoautotrophica TaxID=1469144 RepID=A0A132N5Q8_9ACTN|nr:hypothetical protein [Carbonactinospora thermoautotrophica]KWX05469.1 hypothetical protein TH66_01900 [Carbonactinospora thermoautotrophica]KWX08863.1 hypothetical protein TR74_12990 [Carbonactinospora thermoautotrophica]MCX9193755.1 hypothetical protein [Carbonactinospora thermoautotrophica]